MRLVKLVSVVLAVAAATVAATTQAQSITQYGKAAWAAGIYPSGPNVDRYVGRAYAAPVYSAPVVASAPAADGRRAFSAEPTAPQPPAPNRAEVQRDARPAGRPTARQVSDRHGSDPAPAGEGLNSDFRGAHANVEDLRRRIDADEANLRSLRARLQQRTDVYTGGLTEEQMRALD
jgi:hypothetical protein